MREDRRAWGGRCRQHLLWTLQLACFSGNYSLNILIVSEHPRRHCPQARLKSANVLEDRRAWGGRYRQHVLETFQLARHNQQQRQAIFAGQLRRQALALNGGGGF